MQEHLSAVIRMQDYIHTHLDEPLTLRQLAAAAGYSPWHSARIFSEATGKTPFDYIRLMRLSNAALRLQNRPDRVLDVALDFVFGSHESFTRAFSKEFGVTPKKLQTHPVPLRLFLPDNLRDRLKQMKGESSMENCKPKTSVFVQVIDRPERDCILKRGIKATQYFEYCEEVGCEVWETLSNIKDALYEPIGMWLPPALVKPGTSVYTQGVEVPKGYQGPLPEGYELITLTPCKMMVFQGPPYQDEDFEDAISDLWEIMKGYDPTLYGFEWADNDGPRFQLAPMGYRGYIEARPVKAIKR